MIVIRAQENTLTVPMLERAGIADFFSEVHGKTVQKGQLLTEKRKSLGLTAAQTFFVGDQINDAHSAASAGVVFIHRSGGVHTQEQVAQALSASPLSTPDFRELPKLIRDSAGD
jgi:phosphoglycolate phosphatase-like HAD superfamily hydrolase